MSLFKPEFNALIGSSIQSTLDIDESSVAIGRVLRWNGTNLDFVETVSTIIDISHSDLLALKNGGDLIPAQRYILNSFITKYQQPVTNIIKEAGYVETLVLTASSNMTFDIRVQSTIYEKDIIEYDITDVLCEDSITPRTGKIIHRIDDNNNETYYDHRTVLFDREGTDYLTFNSSSLSYNNIIEKPNYDNVGVYYNNIVSLDSCVNSKFTGECYQLTLKGVQDCNFHSVYGLEVPFIGYKGMILCNVKGYINLSGIDFSLATLLGTSYNKEIFYDSSATPKLSYIDGVTGLVVVTAVNY